MFDLWLFFGFVALAEFYDGGEHCQEENCKGCEQLYPDEAFIENEYVDNERIYDRDIAD